MSSEIRKSGISVVGDIPWGTHFCHFYETREDLLDILIPYFRTGLENNEFCMWIVADPLGEEEARNAFRHAVADADRYLTAGNIEIVPHSVAFEPSRQHSPSKGRIEIIPHTEWYLEEGVFDMQRVANGWKERLTRALAKGYSGMRVNGNEAWLTKDNWTEFLEYEKTLDETLAHQKMIVLCSYPLTGIGAGEIFDVVGAHELAVVRRHRRWEIAESPELKQTKAEIKRLNEELEQRVVKRTQELAAANEALKIEIIQRKKVEAAEKESRHLYESLVQSIDGIVCEMDGRTFRVTFVNKKAETILGYPAEQWVNSPTFWLDHLHPDDRRWALDVKRRAVLKMDDCQLVYRMIAADGRVVWLRDILTVNIEADGSVLLRGVKVEITAHRQAEEALRESEERFSKAFRSSPVTNVIARLADDRFLDVNDAFQQMFGYERSEVINQTALDLGLWVYPEERQGLKHMLREGRAVRDYETRVRTKSGGILNVLLFMELIELGGEQCVLATSYDITARKLAEQRLRTTTEQLRALSTRIQSAREEEATRIAREIHDELGSSLTGLRWHLESLDNTLFQTGGPLQLQGLRENIASMMKLTADILTTVRRISSELRPTVLDDLGLSAAIESQAQQFQARTGIICHCDCRLEDIKLTREQSTAIFRILQEALTNVLRHAHATKVDIGAEERSGEFVLIISDNGRGITPAERAAEGSLGLLGMRERAHLAGGTIEISGVEKHGTTIIIRVPTSH
jgi:PAS domain S-box-containing protein